MLPAMARKYPCVTSMRRIPSRRARIRSGLAKPPRTRPAARAAEAGELGGLVQRPSRAARDSENDVPHLFDTPIRIADRGVARMVWHCRCERALRARCERRSGRYVSGFTPSRLSRGGAARLRHVVLGLRRAGVAETVGVEVVLAQQVVEGGPAHLDVARRAGDVPGVAGERLDHQLPLGVIAHVLQRALWRGRTFPAELEVLRAQVGVLRQD